VASNLIFGRDGSSGNSRAPVLAPRVSEDITADSTSQTSMNVAAPIDNRGYEIVQITTEEKIRIAFGTAPVAAASSILMLGGTTRDFLLATGEKVAITAG